MNFTKNFIFHWKSIGYLRKLEMALVTVRYKLNALNIVNNFLSVKTKALDLKVGLSPSKKNVLFASLKAFYK